ncbi:MAG: hypothetical protein AAFR54_03605 [Planctomycetota bacterium]
MGTLLALLVSLLGGSPEPVAAAESDVRRADAAVRAEPAPVRRAACVLRRALETPCIKRSEATVLLDADGEPRAVVRTRSLVAPLRQVHEREVLFAQGGLRMLHTEEVTPRGRRLVWRELRPDGARSWTVRWDAASARVTGYGWRRPVHEALPGRAAGPFMGPLELADALRSGTFTEGPVRVLDPSAARVVDARVERAGERVRVARPDGTLLFELGPGTVAFQAAAPVRRAEQPEAERLLRRWSFERRSGHEAVLATIRRTR